MNSRIKTILIVDDQPLIRLVLSKSLIKIGDFEILEASNGKEAYSIVNLHSVDVIFCDLNMPDSDGLYLLQRLIQFKYTGAVILISGEDDALLNSTRILAGYYDLNILGIAAKPITSEQIKGYLDSALKSPHFQSQHELTQIESDRLSRLMDDHNVIAYFQPQYDIKTQNIIGFEALARIRDGGKIIGPGQFIQVAENSGLIDKLTKLVIEAALESFSKLDKRYKKISLSINISSIVLEDESFPKWLSNITEQYGLDNESIICELTETMISNDPAIVHVALLRLRMMRFRLSIDDFGTGYASLTQLHALPFDELKIDRCFIIDMLTNAKSLAVCSRSLSLAKDLGLTSVAEGIEDQDTLERLKELGCNFAQGFYLARPEYSEDAIDRINNDQNGAWEVPK